MCRSTVPWIRSSCLGISWRRDLWRLVFAGLFLWYIKHYMIDFFSQRKYKINVIKLLCAILASWFFLFYINPNPYLLKWSFIDSFDLIIHEAGHTIMFFLGDLVRALAGSLFQIIIPLILSSYFFFRREYYSSSLLLIWVGHNTLNVAYYMADAIIQALPLLGGDSVIHDWNYIFSTLNILPYSHVISGVFMFAGYSIMVFGALSVIYFSCTSEDGEVV